MEAIAARIQDGAVESWEALRATFPEVATTTFYRYVALVKKHGVPPPSPKQRGNARETKRQLKIKARAPPKETIPLEEEVAVADAEVLPLRLLEGTIPTLNEVMGFGLFDVARKLEKCIATAERVMEVCTKDDSISNPDLLLRASNHLRQSVESSAKIMEMAWDVKRTEAFHYAIFRRIKDRDPELVKLILEDLRAVSLEMGMVV